MLCSMSSGDESGSVVPLVARVSWRFSPATANTQFYGAAGATYLLRSGDAWEGDEVEKNAVKWQLTPPAEETTALDTTE